MSTVIYMTKAEDGCYQEEGFVSSIWRSVKAAVSTVVETVVTIVNKVVEVVKNNANTILAVANVVVTTAIIWGCFAISPVLGWVSVVVLVVLPLIIWAAAVAYLMAMVR